MVLVVCGHMFAERVALGSFQVVESCCIRSRPKTDDEFCLEYREEMRFPGSEGCIEVFGIGKRGCPGQL